MQKKFVLIKPSGPLKGEVLASGAKNAALVIIASLIMAPGKSILYNIPPLLDVFEMIKILRGLGATIHFDVRSGKLDVDTSKIDKVTSCADTMSKFRASILIAGPLLARFRVAQVTSPGGCPLGARPIDYHVKGFEALGSRMIEKDGELMFEIPKRALAKASRRVIFEYPSVGATENLMMCAASLSGTTTIVNAAFEPEVLDLAAVLQKMGVKIEFVLPHAMRIHGCNKFRPIEHTILPDRMEAGSLLCAIAATGGDGGIPNARPEHMELFLEKLCEMGHKVYKGKNDLGVWLTASRSPRAVSFKTAPYPGFPTDLQAPMMAAQLVARGTSVATETVFDGRFGHVSQFCKMGAHIKVFGQRAVVECGKKLQGTNVVAHDIRAAYALIIAGLSTSGTPMKLYGIRHLERGYTQYDKKLRLLGGDLRISNEQVFTEPMIVR